MQFFPFFPYRTGRVPWAQAWPRVVKAHHYQQAGARPAALTENPFAAQSSDSCTNSFLVLRSQKGPSIPNTIYINAASCMTCLTLTMDNSIRHSSSWVTNGKAETEATLGVQHRGASASSLAFPGSGNVEALICHSTTVVAVPVTIHGQVRSKGQQRSTEGPYPASSHSPIMLPASACVMRSLFPAQKKNGIGF